MNIKYDKNSQQYIAYDKGLDLSGYGRTKDEAIADLKFAIYEYIEHLNEEL